MGKNAITDKATLHFANNTSLSTLHLGSNQITAAGKKILKTNTRITDLDLIGNPIEAHETDELNYSKKSSNSHSVFKFFQKFTFLSCMSPCQETTESDKGLNKKPN